MKRIVLLVGTAVTLVVAAYSCGGDEPVAPPPPANRPPLATGTVPAARIFVDETFTVDVSGYFTDPDGDRLTYDATVSPGTVASASVAGSVVTIVGLAAGQGTVTVTARDPAGLSAQQRIGLNVDDRFGYLNVDIQQDQPDWGAVVLFVAGPMFDSLQAAPDLTLYQVPARGGVLVFVAGAIPQSGTLFRFWTDDRARLREYGGQVSQAAARSYEQRDPGSATITVGR
ncbi:MAG: hypothetical protein F4Y07_00745 [Gemmatimonadetes bacterium]|nr:hypothetical protein [Gemmatimonadota bacterium]MXV94289.1 hypothetical protein [Gemmatimonadota bacterium]MYB07058.1 hypothetical protein [Gemmatimonadota bacterium]MYE14985.1 hypothetical protein [Gemmatimonadota bacterium]MYG21740.1 hypothetical protein [Gemmatimonadota bacterium]